jgi:hypothetical protein
MERDAQILHLKQEISSKNKKPPSSGGGFGSYISIINAERGV